MYRSWAYILMVVATLAGVVGLLWPSPQVRTIEDIAMPARSAPRAEAPAKAPKAAGKSPAKPPRAEPAAAPPAVVKRIPPQTTSTKRAGPVLQNGLQPGILSRMPIAPTPDRGGSAGAAPPKPGSTAPPRPPSMSRPSADQGAREPAAK
jgi:hypothetical protein